MYYTGVYKVTQYNGRENNTTMDFMSRNNQQQSGRVAPSGPTPQPAVPTGAGNPQHQHQGDGFKKAVQALPTWVRAMKVVLLFAVTILAVAVSFFLYSFNPNESKYVNTSKYQAVFLANGQVYFGKLRVVTAKYYSLDNIFYLNTQSQDQTKTDETNKNFTLIKLGCELHGPEDQMVINRDQVTFWENLGSDGQVAKTIATWNKQNPDGQKCQTASATTDQSTTTTGSATGQSAATGTSATTGTTSTTKK
jgi:hypothetical protein